MKQANKTPRTNWNGFKCYAFVTNVRIPHDDKNFFRALKFPFCMFLEKNRTSFPVEITSRPIPAVLASPRQTQTRSIRFAQNTAEQAEFAPSNHKMNIMQSFMNNAAYLA